MHIARTVDMTRLGHDEAYRLAVVRVLAGEPTGKRAEREGANGAVQPVSAA